MGRYFYCKSLGRSVLVTDKSRIAILSWCETMENYLPSWNNLTMAIRKMGQNDFNKYLDGVILRKGSK